MDEKETPEKSSEATLEIEDLDVTDVEDVKGGGRAPDKGIIEIESM